MDKEVKIIKTSTPKFAKMVSNKYAYAPAKDVQKDLEENHNRKISRSYISSLSQTVSNLLLKQEENWEYEIAKMDKEVVTISMGLDGTCMPMGEINWREAMCGTFSFYDINGERMQTIYIANAPEYGKQTFKEKFDKEALAIKNKFPKAEVIGVADGASILPQKSRQFKKKSNSSQKLESHALILTDS